MEAVRVIKEMRDKSGGLYPTFAVWENVPGAFSSNGGEDFRAVLEELARIVEPEVSVSRPAKGKWAKAGFICGDGWSVAWRTFDAQHWGVPQRRRRIALVVDFGGQRAGEILFEHTGVSGHLEPSIPPWKGIARNPAHGTAGHDRVVEEAGAYTLKIRSGCEGGGKGPLVQTEKSATLSTLQDQTLFVAAYPDTARALTARYDGSPCADRGPNAVCYAVRLDNGSASPLAGENVAPTIRQGAGPNGAANVAVCCAAFTAGQGAKANGIGWAEEQAPTLRTDGGLSAMPTVLCRAHGQANAETLEDCCPTLSCNHEQPIVFESHSQDARYTQQGDTSPACTAQWGTGGNNMPLVAEKPCFQNTGVGWWNQSAIGATLRTPCGGDSTKANVVAERKHLRWIARRLIPLEYERLQGYPDGWTDIGEWVDSKGKRHKPSDGPRYKALGNSIALPQWWWLTCKMATYLPEHATLGSLFDGIGGSPLVWETRHGKGTAVWASEIEEFPIAVTKRRFGE